METKKFKVGDRVISFDPIDGNGAVIGVPGTVVCVESRYAVEFDEPIGGHSAGGPRQG